jgi:hypothetical protein
MQRALAVLGVPSKVAAAFAVHAAFVGKWFQRPVAFVLSGRRAAQCRQIGPGPHHSRLSTRGEKHLSNSFRFGQASCS